MDLRFVGLVTMGGDDGRGDKGLRFTTVLSFNSYSSCPSRFPELCSLNGIEMMGFVTTIF